MQAIDATEAPADAGIVYQNGIFNWLGDYEGNCPQCIDYRDLDGGVADGGFDIRVIATSGGTLDDEDGWRAVTVGTLSLSLYSTLDLSLKSVDAGLSWDVSLTYAECGGVSNGGTSNKVNVTPAAPGVWTRFSIPLSELNTDCATPVIATMNVGVHNAHSDVSYLFYVDDVLFQ